MTRILNGTARLEGTTDGFFLHVNEHSDNSKATFWYRHLSDAMRYAESAGYFITATCELCGEECGEGDALCPACKESR